MDRRFALVGRYSVALTTLATRLSQQRSRLLLLALSLPLLAIRSDWFFGAPYRDPWLYYGYFQNGVFYLRHFPHLYYGSRLSLILPGFILHHLLPIEPANLILHVGLWCVALLSFHDAACQLFGERAALLGSVTFGLQPYLLSAVGWNYIDGFGITYFLFGLACAVRAPASPHWRVLLMLSGAAAVAVASVNVFFVVYGPVLLIVFWAVNRQRGCLRLAPGPASGWFLAGAGGLFLALTAFSYAVAGEWFYLRPSFGFLASRAGKPNPFRDASYSWLPHAVWLTFPLLACAGAAVVLWRRRRQVLCADAAPQAGLLLLAGLLLGFQVFGNTAVLQHFFYAALLLPVAGLALAGQLRGLTEALGQRAWIGLVAGAVGCNLFAVLGPPSAIANMQVAPVVPALLAAFGVCLIVASGARGRAALVAVVVLLAANSYLVRHASGLLAQVKDSGADRRGLFLQITAAVEAIDRFDPGHQTRLWYDRQGPAGLVFDATAAAFLLCPSMISGDFPDIHGGRMCDGVQLGPGTLIAVLSTRVDAASLASAAIASLGLEPVSLGRQEVAGPISGFAITFLRADAVRP